MTSCFNNQNLPNGDYEVGVDLGAVIEDIGVTFSLLESLSMTVVDNAQNC